MRTTALALAICSLALPASSQTTWLVDAAAVPPGDGSATTPYASIQFAIDQPTTLDGDTLQVGPGTYLEHIDVYKDLRIEGAGPLLSTIRPDSPGRIVYLQGSSDLIGFTITGGDDDGVVSSQQSEVSIEDCVIVNNAGNGILLRGSISQPGTENEVLRCTSANNGMAGIKCKFSASLNLYDSIIYGNGAENELVLNGGLYNFLPSEIGFNDIEYELEFVGSADKGGNFEANPVFLDPDAGDYRLAPNSPCIGVGSGGSGTDVGALPYDPSLEVGTNYCTAGTSASGCQALIDAYGTPSATAASGFFLSIVGMEGAKDGLFFYGTNGKQANPWGSGTSFVCVIPPRVRGGLLTGKGTPGACNGLFSQDLNARWCSTCPAPAHNPGAGAVMQAQMWYRDPLNTSNQTSSMSDAIEFTVGP